MLRHCIVVSINAAKFEKLANIFCRNMSFFLPSFIFLTYTICWIFTKKRQRKIAVRNSPLQISHTYQTIHPLLRGTDQRPAVLVKPYRDSSPLTRGRHSVFIDGRGNPARALHSALRLRLSALAGLVHASVTRCIMWLSAALNTSLNNLRIISSTFNMPKKYFFYYFF